MPLVQSRPARCLVTAAALAGAAAGIALVVTGSSLVGYVLLALACAGLLLVVGLPSKRPER